MKKKILIPTLFVLSIVGSSVAFGNGGINLKNSEKQEIPASVAKNTPGLKIEAGSPEYVSVDKVKSDIHIPLNLEENVDTLKSKPAVKVKKNKDKDGHLVTAFYKTDKFDVLTSQDANEYGEVQPLIDYIKNTMYGHKEVKEMKVKGHSAVVSERENGLDHLHVVTEDYMYTIAGAETEELLKIANHIDFK